MGVGLNNASCMAETLNPERAFEYFGDVKAFAKEVRDMKEHTEEVVG